MYLLLKRFYIRHWNDNLKTKVRFSSSSAVCGDTLELIEVVSNEKRLPLPYIHLKFKADKALEFKDGTENARVSDAVYRDDVFSLLMNQRITRRIPIMCKKRGVYGISDIGMTFTGIFMNDLCISPVKSASDITVYPNPYDCDGFDILYSRVLGIMERNSNRNPDIFAFRQIREYDTSDPMNTINWKASAKSQSLMVNQYNETTCQAVCILLNLEPEGVLVYERLCEASISIAAGIAERLLADGVSVGIVSNGRDYDNNQPVRLSPSAGPEHIKNIDTALARIDLAAQMDDFAASVKETTKDFETDVFGGDDRDIYYIVISQNTRRDVQECADKVGVDSRNCMFIVPYFKEEEASLDYFDGNVISWEVSHNAQG